MALSNRDKNLLEAFRLSCRYETVPDSSVYLHAGDVYYLHKYAFLIKPADDADKAAMKPDTLYPVVDYQPIKPVKDMTRCDPAVCLSSDGLDIPDIRKLKDIEFIVRKGGTGGSSIPYLYFLKDAGEYKECVGERDLTYSTLTMLPMRPYSFKEETMGGNYDGCTFSLHVFLPLNAPIVVITGDVVRFYCMTCTDFKDILYKPIFINNAFYKLDGWRHGQAPGTSAYQYFKRLKGKDMKLPSPIKREAQKTVIPAQAPAPETPEAPAAEEPVAPPVRALPKRRPAPAPVPPPEPAGSIGDSVTVEEIRQKMQSEDPQVETFDQPINAMEQPMDDAPKGETDRNGYTAPAAPQDAQPGLDAPAEKKRTRKPSPVVPLGFDFGPVLEYTGAQPPDDITADQIEAEIRSLRDLALNISRRMANLTFSMRKTGAAAEAKLKALSDLIGK